MLRTVRALALGFALALSTTACGWIVGEVAEQLHRQSALKDHVYGQDLEVVWREVRDLWTSYGCELPEQPKLGETIACQGDENRWLRVDARSGGHHVEIEVEKTQQDAEGKQTKVRGRDWDLEWKLLERIDPDMASRVNSEANAKGDKAKKATRELEDALGDKQAQ